MIIKTSKTIKELAKEIAILENLPLEYRKDITITDDLKLVLDNKLTSIENWLWKLNKSYRYVWLGYRFNFAPDKEMLFPSMHISYQDFENHRNIIKIIEINNGKEIVELKAFNNLKQGFKEEILILVERVLKKLEKLG